MTPRALLAFALCAALLGATSSQAADPDKAALRQIGDEVSGEQLRATITALTAFGTRHSLSDTKSNTRGIGAARRWAQSRFEAISRDCGGCLQIVTPGQTFSGDRIPTPTEIIDVVAIQRGTTDPNRVIVITGHIDSRNSDALDAVGDAPGANDDASGVAVVIETARILSKRKFAATLVYAALSGEEQGLNGGKVLADYAVAQGWQVEANLNNDIVGNSHGINGVIDNTHVRIFSEGTKAVETPAMAAARRSGGGELDTPSRNLSRFMDRIAEDYLTNFDVKLIYRADRFGRGGDHTRMLEAGFPAVRVTEAAENYDRQHQNVRVENGRAYGDVISGVDFDYLAQVTRLNAVTMAALAWAPPPPREVTLTGGVSPNTTVTWKAPPGAVSYRVWWRDTTEAQWRYSRSAPAGALTLTLPGVIIDDWFFGVSAITTDGYESPVAFPGPQGAWVNPLPAPSAARP